MFFNFKSSERKKKKKRCATMEVLKFSARNFITEISNVAGNTHTFPMPKLYFWSKFPYLLPTEHPISDTVKVS